MNEPPLPPERDPATIDELISAALDGMLDDAAIDLGISQAEAHSLVAIHPGRAAALRDARDLIATPSPLDEVTRRRLVSGAISTPLPVAATGVAMETGRRRLMASVAGIAAALLLLAGIGALLAGRSNQPGADRSAGGVATKARETTLAPGPTADFGEVSDPAVLRDHLKQVPSPLPQATETEGGNASRSSGTAERGGSDTPSQPPADESQAARAPPTSPADAGFDATGTPGGVSRASRSGGADCVSPLTADFAEAGTVVLVATATFEGAPAGVLVLSDDASLTAVVYSAADCAILATQSLTTP